jgi:CBS domain containing-hemolysin-like protein
VVHGGDLDQVVGVVHAKDVLLLDPDERASSTAGDIARNVLVTHEGRLLEDLLLDMRHGRRHLAVVADERGVVSGIVTLEDVVEELIGDFEDESDRHTTRMRQLDDGSYVISGDVRLDELAGRTGIELPAGEWETVAGYVIAHLDRIPRVGDEVPAPTATLEVVSLSGLAIDILKIIRAG